MKAWLRATGIACLLAATGAMGQGAAADTTRWVSDQLEVDMRRGQSARLMQEKIDSAEDRQAYDRRLGTVEPVFAQLRSHEHLDRYTLRSKPKVNGQWLLYCLVHNITKLMRVPEIGYSMR